MAFYMNLGSKSLKASGINMNGSPFAKCGDPGEKPCPKGQAAANAAAEESANKAPKVYDGKFKETGRKKVVGGTEITYSRNFTQTGTGKDKNLPSYASVGVSKEEGDAYWAKKNRSGTETKTRTIRDAIQLDPYGIEPMPMEIKGGAVAGVKIKSNETPGPGGIVKGKGSTKIKIKKPSLSLPLGSGSSKGSGCPGGKKNCGAVNK